MPQPKMFSSVTSWTTPITIPPGRWFTVQNRRAVDESVTVADLVPSRQLADLFAAAPEMLACLRNLVAANNCNYDRDVMRSEGLFSAAEAVIKNLSLPS